jgi:acyl-CoA dehydrogenase
MDFRFDAATEKLRDSLLTFMDEKIYPAEPVFAEQMASLGNRWAWTQTPVMGELRAEARARGLWNLFLPGEHGAGLTNLQYAPLAEITDPASATAVSTSAGPSASFWGGNLPVVPATTTLPVVAVTSAKSRRAAQSRSPEAVKRS